MKEVGTIAEETAAAIVEQLIGGKVDKADARGRGQVGPRLGGARHG